LNRTKHKIRNKRTHWDDKKLPRNVSSEASEKDECHTPIPVRRRIGFFHFKWRYWLRDYFVFQNRHWELSYGVPSHLFCVIPNHKEMTLYLVCESEIRVRNSVDRGEGIRHPSNPVVLARSLLLTYTYFNMFLDNLCLRPWFTYFLIVVFY